MSLPLGGVATSLGWAAGAAATAWLVTWPVRRRSVTWLVSSVAVTGTAASAGALLGAVHSMLLPTSDSIELLLLTVGAGALALAGAALAARRITREHRAVAEGLAELAVGKLPAGRARSFTRNTCSLQAQLQRTAAALAESRERERALERSRRELVAWVSHDLRTPLAGIRAMTEALEDDLAADPQLYYKQMGIAVERLNGMVDDLFELSRVQAGAFGRDSEPVSLHDLISDCIASLEPLANARRIELSGRVDAPAIVRGSVTELNRALTNVLANAIRHTPEAGRVDVRLGRTDNGSADVSVHDECGGIPDDVLTRVFDIGYRGTSERSADPDDDGAGLGLAITRGIIEAHGGTVQVENSGGGCRFRLHLPAA